MQDNNQNTVQIPTPSADAARRGLRFGLILTAIFMLWAFSARFPILIVLFLLSIPIVPYIAYRQTKEYVRLIDSYGIRLSFMQVWAHTLLLFFFGSLVLLLPLYYYIRMIFPGVLDTLEASLTELMSTSSELRNSLNSIYGQDPITAIAQIRTISVWNHLLSALNTQLFIGAILGLINSAILYRRK